MYEVTVLCERLRAGDLANLASPLHSERPSLSLWVLLHLIGLIAPDLRSPHAIPSHRINHPLTSNLTTAMPSDRRRSTRLQTQQKATAGQRGTSARSKRNTPIETSSSSEEERPKRQKTTKILRGTIPIPPLDPASDPAPGEITPANIVQPISGLVHPALRNAWAINKSVNMCFVFDAASPARQFKRGVLFDEDGTFPDYNDEAPGEVTENDVDSPGLMPFMPRDYL